MARGVNKVILVGNLGKDPEFAITKSGESCANFSVATSNSWTDNNGQKQESVEWHNVVAFKRTAEVCRDYLHKGSKVYIEGKLVTQSWKDREHPHITHYRTKIKVFDLQMLDGAQQGHNEPQQKYTGQQIQQQPAQQQPAQQTNRNPNGTQKTHYPDRPAEQQKPPEGFDDFDDDIPF